MGLAEDCQAGVDGHVDQRAAAAAGGGGLVTLGLAEGGDTGVDGHVDQTVADGLLLALDITEDGTTETDGHAEEVASGGDALFTVSWMFDRSENCGSPYSGSGKSHERSNNRLLHLDEEDVELREV